MIDEQFYIQVVKVWNLRFADLFTRYLARQITAALTYR